MLKLRPKVTKPYLSVGLAFHQGMADFYQLPPEQRTFSMLTEGFQKTLDTRMEESEYRKSLDVGLRTLEAYWTKYGQDSDIPQAQTETGGDVEIPHTGGVKFRFRADLVVLNHSSPFLLDFKSGERVDMEGLIAHDLQLARYLWAFERLGKPIERIIYQTLKYSNRGKSPPEFQRRVFTPSKREISWAIHDLAMIVNEVQRVDRLIYAVYNPLCSSGCDYHQLCLVAKLGGDPQPLIEEFYTIGEESGNSPSEGDTQVG